MPPPSSPSSLASSPFKHLGQRLELDRAGLFHALQLTLAAWIAFSIAAYFHLNNAYWAAMPVWVVAQATRGLLLERAVFRVIGTFIGAGVGFLLLYLIHEPYARLVAFGLWIALCSALTHLLRGVHAYGALMSGITAAIIVLPSVLDPTHTVDRAIARVECTLIGVVVVTLVTGFFTPGSARQAFYDKVRKLAADAIDFTAASLRGEPMQSHEKRILKDISGVDTEASLVSSGSLDGYRRLHHVHALTVASLGVMAAGKALRNRAKRAAESDPTSPPFSPTLPAALTTLADDLREKAPDNVILSDLSTVNANGSERLNNALQQLRAANHALYHAPDEADAESFGKKAVYLTPHRDWSLARQTGLVCGLAAFGSAAIGLASGWPAGIMSAIGITIFSMVLSSFPLPQKLAFQMLCGVIGGVLAAMLYRLTIQPHLANNLPLLIISVLPFLFIGSVARSSQRIAVAGLEGSLCFMFVSQAGMPAAAPEVIYTQGASVIICAIIVVGCFILNPRRPVLQAKQAANLICRDLDRLITTPASITWQPDTARQILRLTVHLSRASELGEAAPRGLLAAMNLGHAIVELKAASTKTSTQPEIALPAQTALQRLREFNEYPQEVARELERIANKSAPQSPVIATILHDASAALREGAGLFEFGYVASY